MRRACFLIATLLLVAVLPAVASAAVTFTFDSEGLGDVIARGESGTLTDADGEWTVTGVGPFEGIRFGFNNDDPNDDDWGVRIYNANETELVAKTYTDFDGPNSLTQPYMYVSHELSCGGEDEADNYFTVSEVEFDLYGRPIRFSGNFLIRCATGRDALTGTLDFTFDGNLGAPNFRDGNILVTLDSIVYEYTPAGTFVQAVPVRRGASPPPLWGLDRSSNPGLLDLDMSKNGVLHVFNEQSNLVQFTFADGLSRLSSLDRAGNWVHSIFDDEWNQSSGAEGGLAALGSLVFAVDGPVGGDARGLVRFDSAAGFSAVRFEDSVFYRDVAGGLDGKVYALEPAGTTVQVFDPETLTKTDTVTLATSVDAIAVNASGTIYGVDGSDIFEFDATGALQDSLDTTYTDGFDIDVSKSGVIAIGISRFGFDRVGQFVISDESLTSAMRVEVDTLVDWELTYVGFADSLFTSGFESGNTADWQ